MNQRSGSKGEWRPSPLGPTSDQGGFELELSGDFNADYAKLATYVESLKGAISGRSKPLQRNGPRGEKDNERISLENEARRLFLLAYSKAIYCTLTDGLKDCLPIVELHGRGAEVYPALLPSPDDLAAERALPVGQREGRELTVASFISSLLRDPECGKHLLASMRRPSQCAWDRLEEFSQRGMLNLGIVTIERRDLAAIITLNNGDCLNAEDLDLLNQLELAVDITLLSREVRVGVVRGGVMTHPKYEGRRVFCAGINLRKLGLGQIPVVDYLLSREMGLIEKIRRGLSLPGKSFGPSTVYEKPWIGVVEGFAIGGGFQLLLNFDKVIASEEAYFSLPAAHEGIVPGSANFRLGRFVGGKLARRMILFGEKIYAASEAGRLVCDEVINAESIEPAIDLAVDQLAGPAVVANRHMLNISDEPIEQLLNYLSEFSLVQADRSLSEDVAARANSW